MKQSISLGRIFGIPLGLDYSWFLIFALLTWTLAVSYYPAEFKNWPTLEYWLVGGVTAVLLFVSVLLHELGHSVVAVSLRCWVWQWSWPTAERRWRLRRRPGCPNCRLRLY